MKLRAPEPRDEWISRSALVRLLTNAHERLLVIAAPAGYGKSTLVAQWRTDPAERRRFAWVTLDGTDNDPDVFWTSIQMALDEAAVPSPDDTVPIRRGRRSGPRDKHPQRIVRRLTSQGLRLVFVLDDYHLIRNEVCHRQLVSFAGELPPDVQVAIVTRADPPLPLARFRASGQIRELSVRELRFTVEEIDRFIRRVSNIQLDDAELGMLAEKTEGWPTGVYFAALGMRDSDDPVTFVRGFDGTHRYVADYLSEEVLGSLPDETLRFLGRTSVLDSFTASLCAEVARVLDAETQIGELALSHTFVIPLDDTRSWYRYHRLFRDVIRQMLDTAEPGIVTTLHRRAAAWHRGHSRIGPAIEHALAGADHDGAIKIIVADWLSVALPGGEWTPATRDWVAAIGVDGFSRDPVAAMSVAWMSAMAGDRTATRRWLDTARRLGHEGRFPDGTTSLESSAALLEGVTGLGGTQEMLAVARRAVALEVDPASPWYALAHCNLGCAYYLAGDYGTAIAPLEEAARGVAAFAIVRTLALAALSLAAAELGRESLATDLAEAARSVADEHEIAGSPRASMAHTAFGAALARRGRLEEARAELEAVQRVLRRSPGLALWPALENLHLLIEVLFGLGETDEVRALVDEGGALLAALPADAGRLRGRHTQIERRLYALASAAIPLEPLTDRELAVLRLLRSDLSLREVGARLFVSQNTVKTHARSIYRKLEASSRGEALRRAQEVGLL